MDIVNDLKKKILEHTSSVGIIGVGYVGTAVGEGAANAGFSVVGFDISDEAVLRLNRKHFKRFRGTTNASIAFSRDVVCICVPTPVTDDHTPDLRPLIKALRMTGQYLRRGQLIIIESTVAPGTTRQLAKPLLEEISGLTNENDFFLAFSPERIDPGNTVYTFFNIPKVIGGTGEASLKLASLFYKQIVQTVYPVSTAETAEMSKMLENTFRLVNISLVNELSDYTKAAGIDMKEVIDAASTKPYGFLAHCPGPGVGGHCIPVDPYYLLHDAKSYGIDLSLVDDACRINTLQPQKVVQLTTRIVRKVNGKRRKHVVLLLGVTYKPNISDIRESPALIIWKSLEEKGLDVLYHDLLVPTLNGKQSINLTTSHLKKVDISVLITPHRNLSLRNIFREKIPLLDTTGQLEKYSHPLLYHMFSENNLDDISFHKEHGERRLLYLNV